MDVLGDDTDEMTSLWWLNDAYVLVAFIILFGVLAMMYLGRPNE